MIVARQTLFAHTIGRVLAANGFDVVAIVGPADDASDRARDVTPDLVLVDDDLPHTTAAAVGRDIKAAHPAGTLVAVSSRDDNGKVRKLAEGFEGSVSRDAGGDDFIAYVQRAVEGGAFRPLRARALRRHPLDEVEEAHHRASYLTEREREVLALLTRGASSRQLATRLSLSPHTIRSHVQNILAKLQVHSRLEAAAFATRFGIVEIDLRAGA